MYCAFAAVAIIAARGYSLGAAGKMGAGYFPLLLGYVLAGLGLVARSSSTASRCRLSRAKREETLQE